MYTHLLLWWRLGQHLKFVVARVRLWTAMHEKRIIFQFSSDCIVNLLIDQFLLGIFVPILIFVFIHYIPRFKSVFAANSMGLTAEIDLIGSHLIFGTIWIFTSKHTRFRPTAQQPVQ